MGKDAGEKENTVAPVFVRRFLMMENDQFLQEESHQDRLGTNVRKAHRNVVSRAQEWDGRGGDQPRFTHIANNYVHEIAFFEKQSSFYFMAKTEQANVTNNIVFNIPRAAINFNGRKRKLCSNLRRKIADSNKTDSGL